MNIEKYSQLAVQYYQTEIPPIFLSNLPRKFKTLLDCGCGDGSFIYSILANSKFHHSKIIGIDLSKNRIALIKKNLQNKVVAQVDSAETLSTIPDKSIDVFVSQQVIEHVNDQKMVKSLARVTHPGSYIYISTVIKGRYAWYFYKNSEGKFVLDPTHLREYPDADSIIRLFDHRKFKILKFQQRLFQFPILDLIFKTLKVNNRQIYSNKLLQTLRKLTIPIPNYYMFEIILTRL